MPEAQVTVEELLQRIDASRERMSARNPNRDLLLQCRVAIAWLAARVPEERNQRTPGGLYLP